MNLPDFKILVMGLGSVGKRHIENMEKLGIPCENISILRTRKGTPSFGDEFLATHNNAHTIFTDGKEAFAQKPDIVFVTNPTAFHVPSALSAVKAGAHVFIEKPLSDDKEGVDTLVQEVERSGKVAFVAFNYRFHPFLKKIKAMLAKKELGKIVSVYAENAERISDWHSWEDYKITYGARRDLGGGSLATQSHEFDFLYWLFGKPQWIFAAGGQVTDLEMEVEDSVTALMQFQGNIIATVHLDYIQKPPKRFFEIIGTKGRLRCDFLAPRLDVFPLEGQEKSISVPDDFERNKMYQDEIAHFFDCIINNKRPLIDIAQGRDVVDMIVAARESIASHKIVIF